MKVAFQILMLGHDQQLTQTLTAACRSSSLQLALTTDQTLVDEVDCILLESTLAPEILASVLSRHAEKTIMLSHHEDKRNINDVLAKYPLHHLIGCNGRSPVEEVMITLQKLLTGEIWGVEKYFGSDAVRLQTTINHAADIHAGIEHLLNQLDFGDYFAATHEILRMTVNEFVTNAVYNAPVDANSVPKYEQVDRRNKIRLAKREAVEITAMSDQEKLGVSVCDQFGRLTQEKIIQHFVKCANGVNFIENKSGGAGAGIYLSFYMSNQYIVNVDPGKKLEAICILERNKSYKNYRTRITSFNYFKRGSAA